MNKKKGFTLIELLAVIVILAIIALITIPLIMNVISSAKKGSAKDSAYGYLESIDTWYAKNLLSDSNFKFDGTYTVDSTGKLGNYNLGVKGTKPKGGSLTFTSGKVSSGCLTISDYKVTINNGEVTSVEKGECEATPQQPETYTGEIYRTSPERVPIGYSIESIENYKTKSSEIEQDCYLKHEVVNDIITESYACIRMDNKEYCLQKSKSYEENSFYLQSIENVFTNKGGSCFFRDSPSECHASSLSLYVDDDGHLSAHDDPHACDVYSFDGRVSYCR